MRIVRMRVAPAMARHGDESNYHDNQEQNAADNANGERCILVHKEEPVSVVAWYRVDRYIWLVARVRSLSKDSQWC